MSDMAKVGRKKKEIDKVTWTTRMTREEIDRLRALSLHQNRPINEIFNEAMELYIQKHKLAGVLAQYMKLLNRSE